MLPRLKLLALRLGLLALLAGSAWSAPAGWPAGVPESPPAPVVDLAGLLSAGTQARLDAALRRQWQAGRFQLALLTLPSLEERPIEEVSIQVARAWGLGGAKESNGVLLLIAPRERRLRIEVGSRLEGELPDAVCRRIIAGAMAPRLKAGDADGAALAAVAAISAALAPQDPLAGELEEASLPLRGGAPSLALPFLLTWLLGHPLLLILLLILLQVLLAGALRRAGLAGLRRGSRWGGWGGGGWGGGGGGGYSGGGGGFSGGGSSGGW